MATIDVLGRHARARAGTSRRPLAKVEVEGFALEVDPSAPEVGLWIDSVHRGRFSIPVTRVNNDDRFATVANTNGRAVWDHVSITLCRP